jgi:hypothetical protein
MKGYFTEKQNNQEDVLATVNKILFDQKQQNIKIS